MIEGLSSFAGMKLKDDFIEANQATIKEKGEVEIPRPTYYGDNIHFHVFIKTGDDNSIADITGYKYYYFYKGLYNRSSSSKPRNFTQKDITYIRKYLKEVTA